MLDIADLHAEVAGKPILKGLSLRVNAGEIHAIMGPNGAGKSTLGYTLGGRPGYEVTGGSVTWRNRRFIRPQLPPADSRPENSPAPDFGPVLDINPAISPKPLADIGTPASRTGPVRRRSSRSRRAPARLDL